MKAEQTSGLESSQMQLGSPGPLIGSPVSPCLVALCIGWSLGSAWGHST